MIFSYVVHFGKEKSFFLVKKLFFLLKKGNFAYKTEEKFVG